MGKQHIIELNGKRYDTVTGKIIAQSVIAKDIVKQSAARVTRRAMDGFSAPKTKTQKSQTLMRQSVKKPVLKPKPVVTKSQPQILQTFKQVSSDKFKKAVNIPKHALIKRFGGDVITPKMVIKPSKNPPQIISTPAVATPTLSALDRGLANATSHNQAKLKAPNSLEKLAHKLSIKPRTLAGCITMFVVLVVGGYLVWQNVPVVKMRMAASRSGVPGSLPGYQPAGFGLKDGISYKPGQIDIIYKSNSDARSYQITQASSTWDSLSLLNNYVSLNRRSYQTIEDKGKTLYIYDGSNATWVDAGIWYRIEGNAGLSSQQLQSIASSL